jgi:PAS domain S-box-containing protein
VSDEQAQPAPELDEERRRRRAAEEALRQLEERHRILTECVKDYAIYAISPEGRITLWNEGARRLLGYTAEEALGQHTALTFPEEERRAGRPERELRQAAATGSASDDNWVVRKDGSRFWASGVTTALRDEAGRLCGFVKTFRDLSERWAAEQAVAESEARLRVALAAARMGTWRWDIRSNRDRLDGSLLRLLGLPPGAGAPALRVAVRDNGPGLGPEQRQNLFEAFYTTKTNGTGLGMAIAKRIVDAHGGAIGVGERTRPGAEIVITLPRSSP